MKAVHIVREFAVPENRPFDSCHASTLLKLKNGEILAAFFGGSWEKSPDTAIWVSRKRGAVWEYPRVAADIRGIPMWNPVLFRRNDGGIRLFFKAGKEISEWKTYFADSYDEGDSFTAPAELVSGDASGGRGPVKNKPIRLKSGAVLAPASLEAGGLWDSFVDISTDDCATWTKSAPVPVRRVLPQQDGFALAK